MLQEKKHETFQVTDDKIDIHLPFKRAGHETCWTYDVFQILKHDLETDVYVKVSSKKLPVLRGGSDSHCAYVWIYDDYKNTNDIDNNNDNNNDNSDNNNDDNNDNNNDNSICNLFESPIMGI